MLRILCQVKLCGTPCMNQIVYVSLHFCKHGLPSLVTTQYMLRGGFIIVLDLWSNLFIQHLPWATVYCAGGGGMCADGSGGYPWL